MSDLYHSLPSLFEQLGLGDTDQEIQDFIRQHAPLPDHIKLHEASFWRSSQANFLRQAKEEDADWAGIVDRLDVMLRTKQTKQHE